MSTNDLFKKSLRIAGPIIVGVVLVIFVRWLVRPTSQTITKYVDNSRYMVDIKYDVFKQIGEKCPWVKISKSHNNVTISLRDDEYSYEFKNIFAVAQLSKDTVFYGCTVKNKKITLRYHNNSISTPTVMLASLIDNNLLVSCTQ